MQWASSIKVKEEMKRQTYRRKTIERLREVTATYKPWRKALEETNSANTWISEPPELQGNKLLCKPPAVVLCYGSGAAN